MGNLEVGNDYQFWQIRPLLNTDVVVDPKICKSSYENDNYL